MTNTTLGFPYPAATDPPAGHTQIQALADAVDLQPGVGSFTQAQITAFTAGEKRAGRIVWNSTTGTLQRCDGSAFVDVVLASGAQTLASKTLTTPTIGSMVNANHDHSAGAGGGLIPESSVTNLVSDLAAKLTTPPAWTAWTPALTAATSSPTLGAGATATGYYAQTGKIVHLRGYIVFGGAGVNAGSGAYYISLPVSAALGGAHGGNVLVTDASATGSWLGMMVMNDSGKCFINFANRTDGNNTVSHNAPFAWTTSDSIRFDLTYEAA